MAITGWEMADLVREVCHDMGTGPLVLGGALAGYREFAGAVSAGARFPYAIVGVTDPDQWETGIGTLDGEGRLVREALASSAGGAAVDFAAGEKRVGLALHAGWADAVEGHGHGIGAVEGLGEALGGKQAASATLSALSGVATAAFGRGALGAGDAAAFRAYIGAGTSSSAGTVTSVAMSGGTTGLSVSGGPVTGAGTLTLGGTLGIAHGGTGATSAAAARTALGLGGCATLNVGTAAGTVAAGDDGRIAGAGQLAVANSWTQRNSFQGVTVGSSAAYQVNGAVSACQINGTSNSGASNTIIRWTADANGPVLQLVKSRSGTMGGAAPVAANDSLGNITFGGDDGTILALGPRITGFASEAWSSSARGSEILMFAVAGGSTSQTLAARIAADNVRPGIDNAIGLGTASQRWKEIFAATGAINTSDARMKREIAALPDPLLDAWGDVAWRAFRFEDAWVAKGAAARRHAGLVAQQVRDAIDARLGEGTAVRWGLLCHDDWPATVEVRDETGALVQEAWPAGERWGLRYEECLAVEAAWQRRRMDRIEARLAALEGGGDAG